MRVLCPEERRCEKSPVEKPKRTEQLLITGENLTRLARLFTLLASVPMPKSSLEEGHEEHEFTNSK